MNKNKQKQIQTNKNHDYFTEIMLIIVGLKWYNRDTKQKPTKATECRRMYHEVGI
jgi:hypothetical protein